MQLGTYIRYCREYFALTQQQMAAELNISQGYLSEIETNKKSSKRLRVKVLEKYPITSDFILYLKELGAI